MDEEEQLETLGKLAGILIRALQENRSNAEPKAPRYSEAPRPTAAAGAARHPGPKVRSQRITGSCDTACAEHDNHNDAELVSSTKEI